MKYLVHYGVMRLLGVFSFADNAPLPSGNRVIVRTPRGQEVGTIQCTATPEITAKLESSCIEDRIVRPLTAADERECKKLLQKEQDNFERCQQIIETMGIVLELIRLEYVFGGERLVIYYTAEGRVDFRELIKVLAIEFQIRIEMRQINVREELKLLPCIGECGREVCCSCYLREPPIITIKMAKTQKVTLDPSKITGHCGRHKCCLQYEYECYLDKKKPK